MTSSAAKISEETTSGYIEDDEFGDFEEASFISSSHCSVASPQLTNKDGLSLQPSFLNNFLMDPLSLTDYFDELTDLNDRPFQTITHWLLNSENSDTSFTYSSKSSDLWNSVKVVEDAAALKFLFVDSIINKNYITSLHLDPNLAKLTKLNLPRFAAHFNPLETLMPEKCLETSPASSVNQIPISMESISTPSSSRDSTIVKNPIDIDLDFFASSTNLSNETGMVQTPSVSSKILKTVQRTCITDQIGMECTASSVVGQEAFKIANTFPDLSFMLSPVLMFPIKENPNT